jgi:hypothetical protein
VVGWNVGRIVSLVHFSTIFRSLDNCFVANVPDLDDAPLPRAGPGEEETRTKGTKAGRGGKRKLVAPKR